MAKTEAIPQHKLLAMGKPISQKPAGKPTPKPTKK